MLSAGAVRYRSSLHAAYAQLLARQELSFSYREAMVRWQDGFIGTWHTYWCSFRVVHPDGFVEHVEVAPLARQMPLDKFIYAENQLEHWRWITAEELDQCTRYISSSVPEA